ncbi:DUF2834 domain-containing protein [Mycolicibacterium austroafricanum]|uniref:DUF2834 domain-containing protein n=1 Tax=Mycolicibacterium austroafricanum TaxID=39687 RepID=UPI0005642FF4|nr:DUF2834 domain-containing protein [Mycolicibacterium austroafricanum]QZY47386.1 DUF2834 domain-containing protein [Mycolicibacterium austroafricanum]
MTTTRKTLCGIYAAIAAVALVATWTQNAAYFGDSSGFLKNFLADLTTTAAARSITVDIVLFFLAAAFFMVFEARRIGVPYVWAYIVGGMLIAISVTFPLFLLARERKLAAEGQPDPKPLDVILLSAFAVLALVQVYFVSKG